MDWGLEGLRRVRDLTDQWFTEERTDREVLEAAFGANWTASRMPMMRGLSTRFWFLERPGLVLMAPLARDHEIEPYRRGEPLLERRLWQRGHLCTWIERVEAHPDWATLMEAETNARLRRSRPISGRAPYVFDFWATRTIADAEQRAAVVMLAALSGYADAADLIRETVPAARSEQAQVSSGSGEATQ